MTRLILLAPLALAGCGAYVDPCRVQNLLPHECAQYDGGGFTTGSIPEDNGPDVDDNGPGNGDHSNGGSSDGSSEDGNGGRSHD